MISTMICYTQQCKGYRTYSKEKKIENSVLTRERKGKRKRRMNFVKIVWITLYLTNSMWMRTPNDNI